MTTLADPDAPVSTAGHPTADNKPARPVPPLTAAECAEHAAACLTEAAFPAVAEHRAALLSCAEQWRELGKAMATHPPMNRPRDDRDNHR